MSRVRSILWVLCFGLVAACMSPTIPLPPPEAPTASASTTPGMVHLVGKAADANALILIINTNQTLPLDQQVAGTFASQQGTWDANVYASNGDVLHISQKYGSVESPYIDYTVQLP